MRHSGRDLSRRSPNRRATSARIAASSHGSTCTGTTCASMSKPSSSIQTGRAGGPESRRVSAGATSSRREIDARRSSALGAPAPISTTLQVWPATAALSSARIARSSSLRAMASIVELSSYHGEAARLSCRWRAQRPTRRGAPQGRDDHHFACTLSSVLVRRIRRTLGEEGLQTELLELAGSKRTIAYLDDLTNWISYDEAMALFAAGAELDGRPADRPPRGRGDGRAARRHTGGDADALARLARRDLQRDGARRAASSRRPPCSRRSR